jgi:hypothetical protein
MENMLCRCGMCVLLVRALRVVAWFDVNEHINALCGVHIVDFTVNGDGPYIYY